MAEWRFCEHFVSERAVLLEVLDCCPARAERGRVAERALLADVLDRCPAQTEIGESDGGGS